MLDYKSDLQLIAAEAEEATEPAELMKLATRLYGIARFLDMKGVLDAARIQRQTGKPAEAVVGQAAVH
jgi:hypothetical protein